MLLNRLKMNHMEDMRSLLYQIIYGTVSRFRFFYLYKINPFFLLTISHKRLLVLRERTSTPI